VAGARRLPYCQVLSLLALLAHKSTNTDADGAPQPHLQRARRSTEMAPRNERGTSEALLSLLLYWCNSTNPDAMRWPQLATYPPAERWGPPEQAPSSSYSVPASVAKPQDFVRVGVYPQDGGLVAGKPPSIATGLKNASGGVDMHYGDKLVLRQMHQLTQVLAFKASYAARLRPHALVPEGRLRW
jgi:hypothetical protein